MSYIGTIQDQVEARIDAISTVSGYNTDWGSVSQRDTLFSEFPSAWIRVENEELETPSTVGSYKCTLELVLECWTELDSSEEDPRYQNRDKLYDVYEDIKKAFATSVDAATTTEVTDMVIVKNEKGDRFRPNRIDITLQIIYSQDRNDPSQPGCV
jgi:hypothetical protein